MVPLVAIGKVNAHAARAIGVRLAHLSPQLAVDGAHLVVVAARVIAAHDLPRVGGGHAAVARLKELKALLLLIYK